MAVTIGTIGPYLESEDFETYVDRVELYFDANSIADKQKGFHFSFSCSL